MKTFVLSALAFLGSKAVSAQTTTLSDLNNQRQKTNEAGLMVLGSWSAANIIYGSVAISRSSSSAKYFHQMNVFWNIVNLGIASAGYFTAKNKAGLTYAESLQAQNKVEKIFLLNAGLDVAYIAGGMYLKERAKTSLNNRDRYKGYGESIILQGAALLLFDAIMYGIHNRQGSQLYKLADKVQLASTENGASIVVNL